MALHHVHPAETVHLRSVAEPAAKTAALVKTDGFEAVHLVLRAGDEIAGHRVSGHATIHCLEGLVRLNMREEVQLAAGDWLYLDRGQQHSVSAIEDSALLVTILFD